jgi:hypothetical protein
MYHMCNDDFYDEKLQRYACISLFTKNETDEVKYVEDCEIMSINLTRYSYDTPGFDNEYEIELANGIKWGSTEAEVLTAYGPLSEEDIYHYPEIEGGYVVLDYQDETDKIYTNMMLYISYNYGLFMVSLGKQPIE